MTEVQQLIQELRSKGWSLAAISRELGVTYMAVRRWISGERQPENVVAVTIVLRQMLERRRAPKRPYRRKSGVDWSSGFE
jgi:predicted transcriptional regulator